ncbi:MAG: hypothetical protein U1D67_01465, partial [Dehalococcoidia bacterium]|nr:hypothetical protein [Dehalococcoidia bacterium]
MNGRKPLIAFLGSLPPPAGGFSVGLQRLTEGLEAEGYDYKVYDLLNKRRTSPGGSENIGNRLWWLLRYFLSAGEDLICCHYLDWRIRTAVGMMALLGKKTLISIGGQSLSDSLEKGSWFRRKLIALALRHYSFVIAHNHAINQLCLSLGVKDERLAIIPGFIPPRLKESDIAAIPQEIGEFMASHNPVITANAFDTVFYRGQDLYGLDLCL